MKSSHTAGSSPGFDAFNHHGSSLRLNSEVALQAALREIHRPDHVTWLQAKHCDIIGFAKAGHAQARIVDGDNTYTAIREYAIPTRFIDEPQGSVTEKIWFAQWQYEWRDQSVVCYRFRWIEDGWAKRDYYAVVTDTSNIVDNRCTYTEDLIKACGSWTQKLHEEVYVYQDGDWEKNKALFNAVSKASWEDVILDPVMKADLIRDVKSFFGSRSVYSQYNIPWKRGIILHGPPGCGKTISIKALMKSVHQQNVTSLYVKSFKASGCQTDQASIRQIFVKARAVAPALLIFEDLDSLVTDELRSFFLNEVDGVEENDGLLIIGSTNHLERLDTSITRRPSRFDRKFHFRVPSEPERRLYCQYWQRNLQSTESIDFTDEVCQAVAESTEGFTFAYLKELFVQTLLTFVVAQTEDVESAASRQDAASGVNGTDASGTESATGLEANRLYQTLRQKIEALGEDLDKDDDANEKEGATSGPSESKAKTSDAENGVESHPVP